MWAYSPKVAKLVFFGYKFSKKGYSPTKRFLQNLAWWRKSQIGIVIPNFTILALKMWAYIRKNREKSQFLVLICP